MSVLNSSAALIFNALGGLYLLAVLLRFLLQIAKADFYNPVSQTVIRVTDPAIKVFRSFIPGYRGIDFSSLMLAFVVEAAAICILILLYGGNIPEISLILTWAFVGVIYFILNIYWWAVIASIVMSWILAASGNMNPHYILRLIWQLTEPIMAPVRKVVPPMGGLDFSPIIFFVLISLIQNTLTQNFGMGQLAAVIIGI